MSGQNPTHTTPPHHPTPHNTRRKTSRTHNTHTHTSTSPSPSPSPSPAPRSRYHHRRRSSTSFYENAISEASVEAFRHVTSPPPPPPPPSSSSWKDGFSHHHRRRRSRRGAIGAYSAGEDVILSATTTRRMLLAGYDEDDVDEASGLAFQRGRRRRSLGDDARACRDEEGREREVGVEDGDATTLATLGSNVEEELSLLDLQQRTEIEDTEIDETKIAVRYSTTSSSSSSSPGQLGVSATLTLSTEFNLNLGSLSGEVTREELNEMMVKTVLLRLKEVVAGLDGHAQGGRNVDVVCEDEGEDGER
ncbi:hypothetical protein DM02DRAFT_621440 [Periconia macrospinosa]|uniref:Uncharacterized protein n=1 Tax=Periconia macrospinosa TaxID=97972 RepID=A0A2V1EDJ2_9PLEO|nr:hypothetical protein DM02DRAFT_621440 [Periconia macrospinosa]